jgi:hypothetical protein
MRTMAALALAAQIGASLWSASQAQAPVGQIGAGHVGISAPRVGATTPSAIQSTVARHTGIPSAGALGQRAVDESRGTVASCARRFRSYDASSGTYLGRDGRRHACP